MNIDFNKLTLGEIAKIESLTDRSIDRVFEDGAPKGTALAAIALIVARRTGRPGFTWDDALALPQDEAMTLIGMDNDTDTDTTDVINEAQVGGTVEPGPLDEDADPS